MTDRGPFQGMLHSCLTVSDIDAAKRFYADALGFEPVWEVRDTSLVEGYVGATGVRADIAQLISPISEHVLELITFHEVPIARRSVSPLAPGTGHICFAVADIEAALEILRRLGAEMLGDVTRDEGNGGGCGCYCREPSGSVFELYQKA
jgi:catechol 2,3-dioxygenase-like lactoylglutathione lyase family enzyme